MVVVEILKTKSCPFCPVATEVVNKVAKEFGDKVAVKEIFIDEDKGGMRRAKGLGIVSVPTILVNGMIKFSGVPRETLLRMVIKEALKEEEE